MTEQATINSPGLWAADFCKPAQGGHKYDRGHVAICGAPELTGATRLAAEACSRIGAGLVTVIAPAYTEVYRATLAADIMVQDCSISGLSKVTVYLLGPGGVSAEMMNDVKSSNTYDTCVLDASAVAEVQQFKQAARQIVLTPHEGEFARAFPDLSGSRESRARHAATKFGVTIVLKGPQTLIASSDGRLVRNTHATPYLAKAGTGDVLSGFVTGLIAQKMDPFQASCAAVWIHGETAKRIGPGLVASDMQALVPSVLADLNIH